MKFIITQSTKSWYKHAICLHVLHISAYCGHHQVQTAFTITLNLLYLLILVSVHTLGVHCIAILFM
jgi:hypothetical protein